MSYETFILGFITILHVLKLHTQKMWMYSQIVKSQIYVMVANIIITINSPHLELTIKKKKSNILALENTYL